MLLMLCISILGLSVPSVELSRHWDYFVFSVQWPVTLCSFQKCSKFPDPPGFLIHGLWPTVYPYVNPRKCDPAPPFDEKKISSIKQELDTFWPSLLDNNTDLHFWEHEWKKHGTCALEDSLITTEFEYFLTSLILRARIDLLNHLAEVEVIPNNKTELRMEDLELLLHRIYGVHINLFCLQRDMEPPYLSEVRFCLSPSLTYIDCPSAHHYCGSSATPEGPCSVDYTTGEHEAPDNSDGPAYSTIRCPPGAMVFPST